MPKPGKAAKNVVPTSAKKPSGYSKRDVSKSYTSPRVRHGAFLCKFYVIIYKVGKTPRTFKGEIKMERLKLIVYIPLFIISTIVCIPIIFLAILAEAFEDCDSDDYYLYR